MKILIAFMDVCMYVCIFFWNAAFAIHMAIKKEIINKLQKQNQTKALNEIIG